MREDDVLLMRMDSGSCPLKGKSRGKSSGWGGASRRFKVRVVERAIWAPLSLGPDSGPGVRSAGCECSGPCPSVICVVRVQSHTALSAGLYVLAHGLSALVTHLSRRP